MFTNTISLEIAFSKFVHCDQNGAYLQAHMEHLKCVYSKRTKVFVHRQVSMYRLCHLSTKESVGNQDGNLKYAGIKSSLC